MDQLDNENYEAVHRELRETIPDWDDADLQFPSRKGSMTADKPLEPIPPCDFGALAKEFYSQNYTVC